MNIKELAPWEAMQKQMTYLQLDFIHKLKVLDFGSGNGVTASHFALDNEVIAIEPSIDMLENCCRENRFTKIHGGLNKLKQLEAESFDVILCHNVFEYAEDRQEIMKEFGRVLKKHGLLSILKHNRTGRVMQMVVLLDNFDHAKELLDRENGHAQQFGTINYYEPSDLITWSKAFEIEKMMGMRTFWDLQQNQEKHKDEAWQKQMLEMEKRVSEIDEYRRIAFFHHIILRRK